MTDTAEQASVAPATPSPETRALKDMAREAVERAFLARVNEKYHGHLEIKYTRLDDWTRVATAVTGTAAVAAVLQGTAFWTAWGAGLSALIAAVSAAAATLKWSDAAKTHASLRREWINLRFDWERLQRRALREPNVLAIEIHNRFFELNDAQGDLHGREPPLGDRKLLLKLQRQAEVETKRRPVPPPRRWFRLFGVKRPAAAALTPAPAPRSPGP